MLFYSKWSQVGISKCCFISSKIVFALANGDNPDEIPHFCIISFYPGIQFRLPCTPQDNFSWVPGWETKVSSKKFWFGLCEMAWFLWQPIANLKRGSAYKFTHISAVTYPRLLNLIPN